MPRQWHLRLILCACAHVFESATPGAAASGSRALAFRKGQLLNARVHYTLGHYHTEPQALA